MHGVPDFREGWSAATESSVDQVCALRELLDARFAGTVSDDLDEEDVEQLVYMLAAA